ncbi:Inosose isomerase [Rubripirellula lacrimiformis]|uniref:Inosose isomerase n=1 Tax=Rubripirellula lacrimiformis TaxID=1930273 RepID=A0A517NFA2_9BACT|nr:sugar phosphate isomerase/epimerase family protein [Rubripirellula lacrimiformis]QDT05806.1 Inosose isomerase [Rubripirellula lacrimiformis]
MLDRRDLILAATAAAAATAIPFTQAAAADDESSLLPVTFGLNMSTLRGQGLSVPDQIDVAAKAGYNAVEPWVRDLQKFQSEGGKLADVKKQIEDAGMFVCSAIGFANWIVDDDAARAQALEEAKREMELVRSIGGTHIAAPPVGLHSGESVSPPLDVIGNRYRALLDVGASVGVIPQLELWGFSPTISKLAELAYVATAASHPDACVLPDFYHVYKGGNDFEGLKMIEASRMHCFHINDYPGTPGIDKISDKDRVFPGDGVCELPVIIRGLIDRGFTGTFSLELFNPEYWKRDALAVASEGLEKSQRVVAKAMLL